MHLPSHISTRLQYQHKNLVEIIDGLSEEQVRQQVVPGKWSIFQQIVHLQTYQHTFIGRVKEILKIETADNDFIFLKDLLSDYNRISIEENN